MGCSLETLEWSGCVTLPNSPLNNNGCICPGLGGGGLLYRVHENAQGLWSSRISFKSSNYRDILAILLGLISFCPRVQGRAVQVLTDNVSAAALIPKVSRGPKQGTVRLGDLHLDFRLGEQYVNFCKTSRLEAEYSSQLSLSSHHTVRLEASSSTLQYLDRVWSPHSVNRFASMSSTHLPVYKSWFWHPGTGPVDALAKTDWCMENNDANPPFRVISQVHDRHRESTARQCDADRSKVAGTAMVLTSVASVRLPAHSPSKLTSRLSPATLPTPWSNCYRTATVSELI